MENLFRNPGMTCQVSFQVRDFRLEILTQPKPVTLTYSNCEMSHSILSCSNFILLL